MQEGAEYADYVKFNHCTFLNMVMYTLESGWWHWLSVTNSIFVNPYMFGYIPGVRWHDTSRRSSEYRQHRDDKFQFLRTVHRIPATHSLLPTTATRTSSG